MFRNVCAMIMLLGQAVWAETAFEAYQRLPGEEGARLARIGASDGTPVPERWHFIVYDPTQDGGLRDCVVAGGRIVARNGVSQFVRQVSPQDVLPYRSVRIDSDRVAATAARYAAANDVEIASLNYELRKEPLDAQPVWKVTAFDQKGDRLGWLMLDATDASVIARGGAFSQRPPLSPPIGEPLFDPGNDERGVGGFHRRSSLEMDPDGPPFEPGSARSKSAGRNR